MGALGAVVEVAVLPVFYARHNLLLRSTIALQFIGDEYPWHTGEALQKLAEELLGCLLVPSPLHEHIQHTVVLIHGAPQVMAFALNRREYLVQVPLVARPGTPAPELIGIGSPELRAPLPHGFIGHDDPTDG
jgi:hypothetical protein